MRAAILLLAIFCAQASAHEVNVEIAKQDAAVVRLSYADGNPFVYEAYEIYPPGKDIPEQVGRTNAQGQIVFLPGAQTEWRIKAYTADGHGIDQKVHVSAGGSAVATGSAELPRLLVLLAGLGVVFGLFGVVQLFFRRKRS